MTHKPFARGVTHLMYVGDVAPDPVRGLRRTVLMVTVVTLATDKVIITGKKLTKGQRIAFALAGAFTVIDAVRAGGI